MTGAVLAATKASEAPWWGSTLVAGGFLIAGAIIGLGGTWLSDRRKLQREDMRQWDRDIREAFGRINTAASLVRSSRHYIEIIGPEEFPTAKRTAEQGRDELKSARRDLVLIAQPATLAELDKLLLVVDVFVARLNKEGIDEDVADAITARLDALLLAVKRNLRVDHKDWQPPAPGRHPSDWVPIAAVGVVLVLLIVCAAVFG